MKTIHDKFKLNIYYQTLKLIHTSIKYKSINFGVKNGYVNRYKSGYGSGNGYGDGNGDGDGNGYGYGDGSGYGSGNGYGDKYERGFGNGQGDGHGYGNGRGDGYGYRSGNGYEIWINHNYCLK